MRIFLFLSLLATLLVPLCTRADELPGRTPRELIQSAEDFFHEANELPADKYVEANQLYRQAADKYETVLRESGLRNGEILYNLGNIYFKLDDLGNAILNYRRAERFLPNDAKLQQNLAVARLRCKDNFAVPEKTRVLKTIFFWHYDCSAQCRQTLLLVFSCCFWLLAIAMLYYRPTWLVSLGTLALVFSLALGISLFLETRTFANDNSGVITASQVIARQGDGQNYGEAFQEPLHAGTEFTLLQTRHGWSEIQLPDLNTAWLPNDSFQAVNSVSFQP